MSNADLVNTWARERLAGGPLARDTEAYNQVFGAIPDLIAQLDGAAAPTSAPPPKAKAAAPPPPAPAPAAPDAAVAEQAPAPDPAVKS